MWLRPKGPNLNYIFKFLIGGFPSLIKGSHFCPVMAKNRGLMPTNKRVTHQPEIRKTSVDKALDLIPFFLALLV
jgi:hypothetical protein